MRVKYKIGSSNQADTVGYVVCWRGSKKCLPYRCRWCTYLCFCCPRSTACRRWRRRAAFRRSFRSGGGSAARRGWLWRTKERHSYMNEHLRAAVWSLHSGWPVHLCWRRFPTCRTCPCRAGRWSDHTARLWRWALPEDTAWRCRFCICGALPDNTSLCTLDCRLLKSKKSKRLGFVSDVWACLYSFTSFYPISSDTNYFLLIRRKYQYYSPATRILFQMVQPGQH